MDYKVPVLHENEIASAVYSDTDHKSSDKLQLSVSLIVPIAVISLHDWKIFITSTAISPPYWFSYGIKTVIRTMDFLPEWSRNYENGCNAKSK